MNSVFRILQMKHVVTTSFASATYAPAIGHDSHYWNLTHGAKATLQGGIVIGSVSDVSATYYNPGAISLTSPCLNVLGTGSFGYDNFLTNPDTAGKNGYESNFQDHLRTRYNTSWAIGLGGAYWGDYITVHVSAEWYNAVNEYHPLSLEPFYSQSSGELIQNEIRQQFTSVINAGIGLDYKLNNKVSLAGSLTSDFSANVEVLKSNISLTRWNIYHISAGSSFKVGAAEITLGLSASFAQDEIKQHTDIENPSGKGSAIKPTVDVKFLRVKVLFGFVFLNGRYLLQMKSVLNLQPKDLISQ